MLKDLNQLYHAEPALYERNFSQVGFEWIDINDSTNSVISWLRKGHSEDEFLLFVASFTPAVRENYRVGVPKLGYYQEIFNSDSLKYGGADILNQGDIEAFPVPKHERSHSVNLTLPPLGLIVLKYVREWD